MLELHTRRIPSHNRKQITNVIEGVFVLLSLFAPFRSHKTRVTLTFFIDRRRITERVGVAHLSVGVRQELHLEVPRSRREAHDEDGGAGHLGGDLAVGGSHALRLVHLFYCQFQCQIRLQIRVSFGFGFCSVSVSVRFRFGFCLVSVRFRISFRSKFGFGSGSYSVPFRLCFGSVSVRFRFRFLRNFSVSVVARAERREHSLERA